MRCGLSVYVRQEDLKELVEGKLVALEIGCKETCAYENIHLCVVDDADFGSEEWRPARSGFARRAKELPPWF